MQISSISYFGSSRFFREKNSSWGFTLVELVVAIGIITVLTAIIIAKFSVLDSTTLLKSSAYELASTIREAQTYAVSVLGGQTGFNDPYGVTFRADSDLYTLFEFVGTGRSHYVLGDTSNQTDQYTRHLDKTMKIGDICVHDLSNSDQTDYKCSDKGLSQLDISFIRPEFTAIFTIESLPSFGIGNDDIDKAKIILQSPNGSTKWDVIVGLLGQITVCKEGSTNCD